MIRYNQGQSAHVSVLGELGNSTTAHVFRSQDTTANSDSVAVLVRAEGACADGGKFLKQLRQLQFLPMHATRLKLKHFIIGFAGSCA